MDPQSNSDKDPNADAMEEPVLKDMSERALEWQSIKGTASGGIQ